MKIFKTLAFVFLVLSFLGFVDATFLTVKHFMGEVPPCAIAAGCETVLTSQWNNIWGIPVALFGSLYYLTVFFLSLLFLKLGQRKFIIYAAALTFLGFLASMGFVYLQIYVIRYICIYCMVSAATSTILCTLGGIAVLMDKRRIEKERFIASRLPMK